MGPIESVDTQGGWKDDDDYEWRVTCTWAVIGGRLECVGFEVASFGESGLRPLIGHVPMAALVEAQRADALEALRRLQDGGGPSHGPVRPPRVRVVDEAWPRRDQMLAVAVVYSEEWAAGGQPVAAVKERFKIARSTAGAWVSEARNRYGFLYKTEGRRADGRLTARARAAIERHQQTES